MLNGSFEAVERVHVYPLGAAAVQRVYSSQYMGLCQGEHRSIDVLRVALCASGGKYTASASPRHPSSCGVSVQVLSCLVRIPSEC